MAKKKVKVARKSNAKAKRTAKVAKTTTKASTQVAGKAKAVAKVAAKAKMMAKKPPKHAAKRTASKVAHAMPAKKAAQIARRPQAAGLDSKREKDIGQHIGYRYDVNLLPDYKRITPFLQKYMETMGWQDLNWLEDVHMGFEEGRAAVFDRNINGWVTVPANIKLPSNQQDRDMLARELLIKFQMSGKHPLVELKKAYAKF